MVTWLLAYLFRVLIAVRSLPNKVDFFFGVGGEVGGVERGSQMNFRLRHRLI